MKILKQIKQDKRGISLLETLIAVTIFTFVVTISSNILMDVIHANKRAEISREVFDEVGIIMKQITNEIQNGTIDYEEYFNYHVVNNMSTSTVLGVNNGIYESRFYDAGATLAGGSGANPQNLGLECSYHIDDNPANPCEIIYTLSSDYNIGTNTTSNVKICDGTTSSYNSTAFCDPAAEVNISHGKNPTNNIVNNLFLIDKTGTKKTIIVKKNITGSEYGIGILKMTGLDLDQNGTTDTFTCNKEYICSATNAEINAAIKNGYDTNDYPIALPKILDKDTPLDYTQSNFSIITPLHLNITQLDFIITPLDNPYIAFAEQDLQHPTVTIILQAELASDFQDEYPGDFRPIKVQTTVSAGVVGVTSAYPPINELYDASYTSWINTLL